MPEVAAPPTDRPWSKGITKLARDESGMAIEVTVETPITDNLRLMVLNCHAQASIQMAELEVRYMPREDVVKLYKKYYYLKHPGDLELT